MILWTLKLISTVRRAIAGRRYPHQLAWAVAFGLLLGVVPHGNLLALALLVLILSLSLNHAMAALTAIAASFLATRLDPYSHEIGEWVLTHPRVAPLAEATWQLPMMPWTDLNNTVVMGSFLIGATAIVPVFLVTYPVFRWLAPRETEPLDGHPHDPDRSVTPADSHFVMIDQGHATDAASRPRPANTSPAQAETEGEDAFTDTGAPTIPIETRIDVIRMKAFPDADSAKDSGQTPDSRSGGSPDAQPMDEALNYLLRQLRDSKQRKAA